MASSVDSVFRDYNTQGIPASGDHKPRKPDIRALLKQIQNSGGLAVTRNTFAALSGVTPPTENYMGIVLDDPDATKNGYYSRVSAAWVFERGFPDTFARLTLAGTGTARTASVATGVNPSDIEVFFAVVNTTNTGAITLSVSGGTARAVVNAAGNALTAGEWTGVVLFFLNDDNEYQLINDAGAAASATASATAAGEEADRAETAADAAEAAVAGVSVTSFATRALAIASTPAVATDYIRIEGYTAAGDGGGALYKKVVAEPSHAGKFSITVGGAPVWYELAETALTPEMFGAKGDGIVDDTVAFEALADMPGPLMVNASARPYLLNRQIIFSGKDLSFSGAGMGATKLVWGTAATSLGLRFLDNSGISPNTRAIVKVQSLTLATKRVGLGSAISANYSVTDDAPFGESPTITLEDLDIRGFDFYEPTFGSHWWQRGVDLVDTGSVVIRGVSVVGLPNKANDAFRIQAVESPNIRFFFNSCKAVYIQNGLHIVCGSTFARVEGVYLSQTEFVACLHGILVEGGPSHAIQFENGHIDSDAACIDFSTGSEGSVTFKLAGSYVSMGNKWAGSYISGYAVSLGSTVQSTITGNRIEGDPGKTVVQGGVILNSANGSLISDNIFSTLDTGVGLAGSCVNCHGIDNVFNNVTTRYVGSGTGCSFSQSGSGFADFFGGMKVKAGTGVITLNAGGDGTIAFPTAFPATFTSAVVCNGDPSIFGDASFGVRQGSSNASTLAVSVRPNPGAVTVRVNWTAFGT